MYLYDNKETISKNQKSDKQKIIIKDPIKNRFEEFDKINFFIGKFKFS